MICKYSLKQMIEMSDEKRKEIKTIDKNSFDLYQMYLKKYVNTHSKLREYKENLSKKLYYANEQEILRELSSKPVKKELTPDEMIQRYNNQMERLKVKITNLKTITKQK